MKKNTSSTQLFAEMGKKWDKQLTIYAELL